NHGGDANPVRALGRLCASVGRRTGTRTSGPREAEARSEAPPQNPYGSNAGSPPACAGASAQANSEQPKVDDTSTREPGSITTTDGPATRVSPMRRSPAITN